MGVVALATYSHGCEGRSPSLKTLINTIISTFTDIQEFSLGCLFLFKKLKFTLLLFETSKGYFSCCLIYCFSSIDISLRYLDVTMSKCF